ncbi:MAG: molybdenum cofactor guanylyltransferase [Synoicihabitans sp.]
MTFDAVVLAGGQSRRMGTDKALLPHPQSGQSLVLHQLNLLQTVNATRRFVSARPGQKLPILPPDVTRIDDAGTEGPLAGIVATLNITTQSHLLVIPVDLPFLSGSVLQKLSSAAVTLERGIYAETESGPEPLVSLIPRSLKPRLDDAIAGGQRSPRALFSGKLANEMHPLKFEDEVPFQNWNHPNDI